jgi:ankyrin repeat protein
LNALQSESDTCFWVLLPVTSQDAINSRTKGGKSPLFEGIFIGRVDILQGLLDHGADVEIRGTQQQTALFEAVGHFADPNALVQAAIQTETLGRDFPAFLRKTTSPFLTEEANAQSMSQYPPNKLALLPEIAKHLMKGDSPEMRNVVQLFLDAGADVNAVSRDKKLTPFLYAAEIGNPWLLKALIDHGADLRSQDARGGTAFSRLHFFGHSSLTSDFLSWLAPSDRLWLREKPFQ